MTQRYPPPTKTNIDHWTEWALKGYIEGDNTIEQFEQAMDDALHGRYVNFDGTPCDDHKQ